MKTEIIKIIEGGLERDRAKVLRYAKQLAMNQKKNGDANLAQRIEESISSVKGSFIALEELASLPVDSETRANMVKMFYPKTSKDGFILSPTIQEKIDNFINFIKRQDELIKYNLSTNQSLLLYGPPGCGKTTTALKVAEMLDLPIIIVKLDSTISSLLGNTAKNINRIFTHAKKQPCILFLDEFDAIAKARNDSNELGELKRVVNSLIQNIDELLVEGGILIAATNHQELLDKAIWRRFSTQIFLGLPSYEDRQKLIKMFLSKYHNDIINSPKKLGRIAELLENYSPSDIQNVCDMAIKRNIIKDLGSLEYGMLILDIFLCYNSNSCDLEYMVKFLNENQVPQDNICSLLNISIRQVRKYLTLNRE
ncbi:AAA family ATPase [Leptospira santarosai]|uniref:AAA+ ATPase domain-containing protein n=1 Tax=Leptospira santarosai TaxID=28183 RepID=A0AB73N6A1_9LEPT|nr:ATP-binding protein [Leptospira santarosai]ONF90598.1 hypothetical protein BWD14_19540 [Leptospira santarosai]